MATATSCWARASWQQAAAGCCRTRVVRDLGGRRFVLSHGDALCTGDLAYQRFRRVVRSAAFQKSWHLLPLGMRRGLAALARRRSRAYTRRLPDSIADVDAGSGQRNYCAPLAPRCWCTATRTARTCTVSRWTAAARTRIVLGDWHERGNALAVYTDGRYEFLNIEASGASMSYSGRCGCGKVVLAIAGEPVATRQCWCRQCQRIALGGPTHNAMFRTEDLRIEGTLASHAYVARSGNTLTLWFCPGLWNARLRPEFGAPAIPHRAIRRAGPAPWPQAAHGDLDGGSPGVGADRSVAGAFCAAATATATGKTYRDR